MEGDTPDLPALVALKKKYGAYLWVDEAHSIGALGATGRGLCEHQRVDVLDIDVSMGTFTKAFGAIGGYIAANTDVIAALRARSSVHTLSGSLAPPACAQALAALRELQSTAGLDRVRRLQENSQWFRARLLEAGLAVLGNEASSPVCPVRASHCIHDAHAGCIPQPFYLEHHTRFCSAFQRKSLPFRASASLEMWPSSSWATRPLRCSCRGPAFAFRQRTRATISNARSRSFCKWPNRATCAIGTAFADESARVQAMARYTSELENTVTVFTRERALTLGSSKDQLELGKSEQWEGKNKEKESQRERYKIETSSTLVMASQTRRWQKRHMKCSTHDTEKTIKTATRHGAKTNHTATRG
jgi:hypothetical protein